jgi:molybdopterin/thiamine biosynthesis adenylyltransferase
MTSPRKITIAGAGGLGTPAAIAIARNWPGEMPLHLSLIDPDRIERSNLNRQVLFTPEDIGREKCEVLAERLDELFGAKERRISFAAHPVELNASRADELLGESDVVIDGTDSVAAKVLINDWCVEQGKPFVHAGVVGESGQALYAAPGGACLRCLFGEFSNADIDTREATCATAGILGPVAGALGFFSGHAAIRSALSPAGEAPVSQLARYDSASLALTNCQVPPSRECSLGCAAIERATLDLRGKECPETFVFSKLAYQQLRPGALVELRFRALETAENVAQTFWSQRIAFPASPRPGQNGEWILRCRKPPLREGERLAANQ